MLEPAAILGYLSDAASFGDATYPSFSADAPQWVVSFDDFASGGLSSHATREIMLAYSFDHEDVDFGGQAIPLLCCLRSILYERDEQRTPLLCMRAMLDANGSLSPFPNAAAWIPTEVLEESPYRSESLSVCDYDTYRAHEAAMLSLPSDGSWSSAVERAIDLFDSVCELTPETLALLEATLDDASCVLSIWERPDDLREAAHVLGSAHELMETEDESADIILQNVSLGALTLAAHDDPHTDSAHDHADAELPDEVFIAPKLLCGIPDHLPALSGKEREAIVDVARRRAGDLHAVCAPKGTGARPVAIGSMANLLTTHALRGELAPVMACIGSRSDLEAMVELLENRPIAGQVALNSRWLTRISKTNARGTERVERRTLGPLQTLCLMHASDGVGHIDVGRCLQQPFAHPYGGDPAQYSNEWYVPKAAIYFLDCVSSFMGERVQSLARAGALLSDHLRRIDQDRCELIDAYAGVCNASELMRQRDGLVARISRLRRGHTVCRERLRFWERLIRENQPRRSLLGKQTQNQAELIARHMQRGEELAKGKTRIADVCEAYRTEIGRIETSIDRLRGASANLTRRIKAAEPHGKKCAEIIGRLGEACGLDATQTALLEASIDGRSSEVSIAHLDDVLDLTVRPAEFWLSVHIYESRWLSAGQRRLNQPRTLREGSKPAWKDWASLCPFQLVPSDIATSVVTRLGGGDMETVRLSVVLDADEMDIPRGAAIALCSDQMVVFGSAASLGAKALRHQAFDEVRVRSTMGDGAWADLSAQGLCVSSDSSFFSYAQDRPGVSRTRLADTYESYGELDDLRSELFPGERLHTHRVPAHSADDDAYPLADIVPSISYVLVPDSSWEQRGHSRRNHAEAQALARWMANHIDEMLQRFKGEERPPLLLVSPFRAQADLLRTYVDGLAPAVRQRVEVRALCDLGEELWPIVILCATCGPEAYDGLGSADARHVLALSAAASRYALVVFCGGAWMRSHEPVAKAILKYATRVGRLFSAPRRRRPPVQEGDAPTTAPTDAPVFRSKPLSISALLNVLKMRNEIDVLPEPAEVNKALMKAGLIERAKDHKGKAGWRPTAAGREVGIIAKKDHYGHPFCVYTRDSEAVVTSVVETVVETMK